MDKETKSFPVWATFFTLICAVILCSLGTWQVIRLEWKQDLLASLAKEYDKNAKDYPLKFSDLKLLQKNEVKRGVISGVFVGDYQIFVHSNQDYDVYVPMSLDNGHVLVALGWSKSKDNVDFPDRSEIVGSARVKGSPWRFGIKNMPDKGEWVYLDIGGVRKYTGLDDISNSVFYAEEIIPAIDEVTVSTTRYEPNNNHLKYAIFWFTMCFVMLVIYYKRFLMPAK